VRGDRAGRRGSRADDEGAGAHRAPALVGRVRRMGQRPLQVHGRGPQAPAGPSGPRVVGRRHAGGGAARRRLLRGLAPGAHHLPDLPAAHEEDQRDVRGAGQTDDHDRGGAGDEHRRHDPVGGGAAERAGPHQERQRAEVLGEAEVRRVHEDRGARRIDPRGHARRHRPGDPAVPGARLRPAGDRLPHALSGLPAADRDLREGSPAARAGRARGSRRAMKTVATTKGTHYEIQEKRRESRLGEWKGYHKTVLTRKDVVMHDVPSRRMRRGVFAGWDGDRPTKNLDATVHEVPAHTTTTIHRHSWDAIQFIESGRGWTEIDGQRVDWKPWDTLHLPSWAWHRHGNEGDTPAVFHTWSVQPMLEQFGVALLEDGGDTPVEKLAPRPRQIQPIAGDDPYARRTQRLAQQYAGTESARLITRFHDVRGLVTKRGARSLFLVDKSIGYHTA